MSAGRDELDRLLAELLDHPEREREITRAIDERFACDCAVMVLDMRLTAENERRTDDRRLYVSIGIGFGRILDLGDDLFGDEVNLASKLGEDIARMGEVLLTSGANAALRSAVVLREQSVSVSGLALTYYRVS